LSDVRELVNALTPASVVGLGEPIHGSHEFHVARARVIQGLVSQGRFRAITFESPRLFSQAAADYVRSCKGSPEDALKALYFAAWQDEAILDLLRWLCEFNRSHPGDEVVLFGFDIQGASDDKQLILRHLKSSKDTQLMGLQASIGTCVDQESKQISGKAVNECKTAIDKLRASLPQRDLSDETFSLALSLDSLKSYQEMKLFHLGAPGVMKEPSASNEARDGTMASNFLKMMERLSIKRGVEIKAVVYGHNFHIMDQSAYSQVEPGARSMGSFLKFRFKDRYVPVGFLGYQIGLDHTMFPAKSFPDPQLPERLPPGDGPIPTWIEAELHHQQIKTAWVDLNDKFLLDNHYYVMQDQGRPGIAVPSAHYRFLFFLDQSGPLIDGIKPSNVPIR
jgi:erythromycin esterase